MCIQTGGKIIDIESIGQVEVLAQIFPSLKTAWIFRKDVHLRGNSYWKWIQPAATAIPGNAQCQTVHLIGNSVQKVHCNSESHIVCQKQMGPAKVEDNKFVMLALQMRMMVKRQLDSMNAKPCGSWISYRDQKCVKLIDKIDTFQIATEVCQKEDPAATLLTLESKREQDFFENLLFNTFGVENSVWLNGQRHQDAKRDKFSWTGDSQMSYSNWKEGHPNTTATTDKNCLQMSSPESGNGQWIDVTCSKYNMIVCQKAAKTEMSYWQQRIMDLVKSLIPIGFIYTQLPTQPAPEELWPQFEWTEISSEFDGLFFRVVGNDTAPFGDMQNSNSPRLVGVQRQDFDGSMGNITVEVGKQSDYIYTGQNEGPHEGPHEGSYSKSLSFLVSDDEVRPQNKAVKIWKRTD